MSDGTWTLVPRQGIEKGALELRFGQERANVRLLLAEEFAPLTAGNFADEDDFYSASRGTHVRVRYADERVQDIEFLAGSLRYLDIELSSGTTRTQVESALAKHGFSFADATWLGDGRECEALAINIATPADVGGDDEDDSIEWVILSRNFEG